MLGAIAGDIIGSVHEYSATKTTNFELFVAQSNFTDDSVLTIAVADCILHDKQYGRTFQEYFMKYPGCGYGLGFAHWAQSRSAEPYNSFGNGSAMRVSPVAWSSSSLEDVLAEARRSADVTHNHPEGIKGAQATAAAAFLARQGKSKQEIRSAIEQLTGYNLNRRLDDIRPSYSFNETCQGTVPEAIIAFMESENYEDAVRKAISLGGDADTLACITGAIAEAFYGGVPTFIEDKVVTLLDDHLRAIVLEFSNRYGTKSS